MAEIDKIIELGGEPGFSRSVFNAVYTLLVLKYYTNILGVYVSPGEINITLFYQLHICFSCW